MKKANKKKKNLLRRIVFILLFEFIVTVVTAPFIIFYGPFENLKKALVGSLYSTLSHRYMVELFLSEQSISKIIGSDGFYTSSNAGNNIQNLIFNTTRSDKIEFMQIDGGSLRMKGYLLLVHDPMSVKVGYSSKLPIEGELTSEIAKREKALAAVNAGGFGYSGAWASTGGKFEGFIMRDGKIIGNNLKDDNEPYDTIGFNNKGKLIFGKYSINSLKRLGVGEAVCFCGPPLIVDGKKQFTASAVGGKGLDPRTAIGQRADGKVLLLVIEGRDLLGGSFGASMYDLQEILSQQGAVNAINLDGGSSSAMYYNGKLINRPSNAMGERTIPSAFIVLPHASGGVK